MVVLVRGVKEKAMLTKEVVPANVLVALMDELPLKQAVKLACQITGERRNVLYEEALLMKADTAV